MEESGNRMSYDVAAYKVVGNWICPFCNRCIGIWRSWWETYERDKDGVPHLARITTKDVDRSMSHMKKPIMGDENPYTNYICEGSWEPTHTDDRWKGGYNGR